jgi:hypothetical protein
MAKTKKVHVVGIDDSGDIYHAVYADLATYRAARERVPTTIDDKGVFHLWNDDIDGELPVDEDGEIDEEACEAEGIDVDFGTVLEYKHYLIKGDNIKVVDRT